MENDALNGDYRRGALMAIGGAEDKVKERRLLNEFMALAGGKSARIAIIPAASMQAEYTGSLYRTLFEELNAQDVRVLHVDSRLDAQDELKVHVLDNSTSIFLTGGNQLRLATLLSGTRVGDAIRRRSHPCRRRRPR